MDWGDSSELIEIFRAEVTDRAAHLVEGAQTLIDGSFVPNPGQDLTRDAHTIKGSARVMGFDFAADGANLMEATWKVLENGGMEPNAELGHHLLAIARAIPVAVESGAAEDVADLQRVVAALNQHLRGPGTNPSGGVSDASLPQLIVKNGSSSVDPGATGSPGPIAEAPSMQSPVNLGGLLPSLHDTLVSGTTRVETPKLYQLINRAVEARLNARTLLNKAIEVSEAMVAGATDESARELRELAAASSSALDEVEQQALDLASTRLREMTGTFPQLVRFVSRRTGKEVRFELIGDDIEIDRQILERLHEPLRHLLVNAIDHGIEPPEERQRAGKGPTGTVSMRAVSNGHRLQILVTDDGAGIDWEKVASQGVKSGAISETLTDDQAELARLLYAPGFSTVPSSNDISGDGSGLAAVASLAEELNGGLEVASNPGQGTSVTLTLPSSTALQDVFLVEAEGQQWGLPATAVIAALPISEADIVPGDERMMLSHNGATIPLASFAAAVGLSESENVTEVLVVSTRLGQLALTVPKVIGRRQVAVKGIGPLLGGEPHIIGAALLGGGRVVVIVEPNRIGDRVRSVPQPVSGRPRVLIVDDSKGVRQLVAAALSSSGFEAVVAADSEEAMGKLAEELFDALVVDYMMPGWDGIELVSTVRNDRPDLKIVMVSGVALDSDAERARAAGVDAYLDKSDLRQGVLVATLRSLLGVVDERRQSGLAI